MGAGAYVVGEHIVVGDGERDRRTLAHEIAHVLQGRAQPELAGRVQREMFLADPKGKPAFGPATFQAQTRAQILTDWLKTLCPTTGAHVNLSTGRVGLDDYGFCADMVFYPEKVKKDALSASCQCLCNAEDSATPHIDIVINETVPTTIKARDPKQSRSLLPVGGAQTIVPKTDPSCDVPNTAVVTSGTLMTPKPLAGAADPQSQTAGAVTTPGWLILAHEICGHVLENPSAPGSHLQTEAGNPTPVHPP